jgi:hypothetical protein
MSAADFTDAIMLRRPISTPWQKESAKSGGTTSERDST